MAGSLLPQPRQLFQDSAWNPGIAYQLYSYDVGTLTPKATYKDAALTIANTNPVIANARGEAAMFGNGAYRLILKDSLGNLIWDQDNVEPASSIAQAAAAAAVGALALPTGAASIGYDDTSLAFFIKSRIDRVVDSVAALRALDKSKYTRAFVTGYYAASDGGGGQYNYDAADTTSTDNGGTVIVATDNGRWKLSPAPTVDVRQFGAKGDGVTDSTAALAAALATGKDVIIPTGATIKFTTVTMSTRNQRLIGPGALDGKVIIKMAQSGDPYTSIIANICLQDLRFITATAAVVIQRGRSIRISGCTFENSAVGAIVIQPGVDDFDNANHAVEDVNITKNFFGFVDRCLYIDTTVIAGASGFQWFQGCGDVTFAENTARVAKITHIEGDRVDGMVITGNTMLHYGSASRVSTKKRCIEINVRSAQIIITGNQLFEPGLEAIYLKECTSSVVTGNNIVQPGQVALSSGIKLTYSGAGYGYTGTVDANALICGNQIYQPSLHGIELNNQSYVTATGNHTAIDNFSTSYYGDTLGQPAMSSVAKRYAVFASKSGGALPTEVLVMNNYSKQQNAEKNPDAILFAPFQKTRQDITTAATSLMGEFDQINLVQPSATTVTAMTGAYDGKETTLLAFNGNTTIANNAVIKTKTGANTVLASGTATRFYAYGGVWYQF